jgi:hypothetical protein
VISGRTADNAPADFIVCEPRNLVIGPAQLEREDRLKILALHQKSVAQAFGEVLCELQWRLVCNVINPGVADPVQVFDSVHSALIAHRSAYRKGQAAGFVAVVINPAPFHNERVSKLFISNVRLVNEGEIRDVDVLVEGDRIARIDSGIRAPDSAVVIDGGGKYLLPGMIDDQVHFREPGLTHKGDLATESAAAAAGGITSFMDMPNVNPLTTTREALADKYRIATDRCTGNYGFYLGATNSNIEEIKALQVGEACGIKAFMGASTGDMLVDDPDTLDKLFEYAPVIVVTHCEDSPTIWANEDAAREKFGEEVPFTEHPGIRSAEACYASSSMAIDLARRHDALLHVLHLTTEKEMALFSSAHRSEKRNLATRNLARRSSAIRQSSVRKIEEH